MKMMKYLIAGAALACALVATSAYADDANTNTMLVSTGGASGTYYQLVDQMKNFCADVVSIDQWKDDSGKLSSGSPQNLDNILNNQSELAVVQTDALFLRNNVDPDNVSRILTLIPLHSEEVHLIAKSAPRSKGGVMGFGATQYTLNDLADLNGLKVGAWGGSVVTAKVINFNANAGMQVVEYPDQPTAQAALDKGDIDAILAVGGQPLGWVKTLTPDYKLHSIDASIAKQLEQIYRPASLSYSNLGQSAIPTVAGDALLVTRDYKSKNRVNQLLALRKCIVDRIDDIRDTRGTHPKWQEIDPTKASKWPHIFEAPAATTAAAPATGSGG